MAEEASSKVLDLDAYEPPEDYIPIPPHVPIDYGEDLMSAYQEIVGTKCTKENERDPIQVVDSLMVLRKQFMIVVKGKEFIHDEIIDMHLAMLRPHIQKGGVWLTNTKFMELFYDFTKDECNFTFRKVFDKMTISEWEAFDELIVPINHFFHWLLLIVHIKTRKMFWKDSLPALDRRSGHRDPTILGSKYMSAMKKLLHHKLAIDIHSWTLEYPETQLQKQFSVDCALHVILNVREHFGYPVHHPLTDDLRKDLCLDILRGKLVTETHACLK